MKTILLIGACSAIARATARRYAQAGCSLFLVARNASALEEQKQDLLLRGASAVHSAVLDVNDTALHGDVVEQAREALGTMDLALICHGTLPGQKRCEHDYPAIADTLQTNALSTIALLCQLVPVFQQQKSGCIAVITSVAGDRGRASNYIYGTAKAAVSTYLQGLRASLHGSGVHIMDIRPGFVDTPMTTAFRKGLLWSTPEKVARAIQRGVSRRRNVLYVPWFWRWIMLVIRCIPEALFKRLSL